MSLFEQFVWLQFCYIIDKKKENTYGPSAYIKIFLP